MTAKIDSHDPSAQSELRAVLAIFSRVTEPYKVIGGLTIFVVFGAGGMLWYYKGWLLGLGFSLGGAIVAFAVVFALQAPVKRRAAAAVANIESQYNLTHDESLELILSDAEAAKVSEFNDFVLAVWGETAGKQAATAKALAAGGTTTPGSPPREILSVTAIDRKLPTFEVELEFDSQPTMEQIGPLWTKYREGKPGSEKVTATMAETIVKTGIYRMFHELLPGLPAPPSCCGCGSADVSKKLCQEYQEVFTYHLKIETGSPFLDQNTSKTLKHNQHVEWPLCEACAARIERTKSVLAGLSDTLKPSWSMFSGKKRAENLQQVQQALNDSGFDAEEDLLLPPLIGELQQTVYLDLHQPTVLKKMAMAMAPTLERPAVILSMEQRVSLTFPSILAAKKQARAARGQWEVHSDGTESETDLWPACWGVRGKASTYRIV